jgi:hypothetical protein
VVLSHSFKYLNWRNVKWQQLAAPEVGWKRYDDTDQNITYGAGWAADVPSPSYYNNTSHSTRVNSKLRFNFTGTRLRLIDTISSNRTKTATIVIDGVSEPLPCYSPNTVTQALYYEKLNLSNTEHSIEISGTDLSNSCMLSFDALDIDKNGELKPYKPTPSGSDQAILRVTMIDSSEREYKLPKADIDGFVTWFTRTVGTGTTVYVLNKMTGSKDYLAFDKIISFEVIPVA